MYAYFKILNPNRAEILISHLIHAGGRSLSPFIAVIKGQNKKQIILHLFNSKTAKNRY